MSLEHLNFEDMCEMMFYGPMMDCLNNEEAKFAHMSLWGGLKATELFNNNSLSMHKTSANLLRVLKDYCCKETSVKSCEEHFTSGELNEKQQTGSDLFYSEDNELFNELSCTKGTFDDEIVYYLDKADQDKSDFDDLSANNSRDNININHSSSSTSSNDNIDKSDDDSDNLLISDDNEKDRGNLLVSEDIDNDHCSHDDFLIINDRDTCDDHNQSNEDEPLLDNSDMDFLGKSGKSGSAKDDIEFLPDLFNDVGQLQETVNTELIDMNWYEWYKQLY